MNDMKLLRKFASILGKRGGKKSAETRFKDMTPAEKSAYMSRVRKQSDKSFSDAIKQLESPEAIADRVKFLRDIGQIKD